MTTKTSTRAYVYDSKDRLSYRHTPKFLFWDVTRKHKKQNKRFLLCSKISNFTLVVDNLDSERCEFLFFFKNI